MGYTWGYIKDVVLAKLDLNEKEAQVQNLIGRFPFYANEVITQVCSAIKAKNSYFTVKVFTEFEYQHVLDAFLESELNTYLKRCTPEDWNITTDGIFTENDLTTAQQSVWAVKLAELKTYFSKYNALIGQVVSKPDDFVSWNGDIAYFEETIWDTNGDVISKLPICEAHDDDYLYMGDEGLSFLKNGTYYIPYGARWFTFTKELDNNTVLNIPNDILDCIPSYIAHQCYKIDDETKSAIFRNEYELFLSRIDDTNYKNTKTIKIGGGW